jgi:hypothetical protein
MASGLVPKMKRVFSVELSVTEGDAALRQIVGGKFEGDSITRQNADAISPQPAGQVRQDHAILLQLNAELAARELFENGSGYFNAVFFAQIKSNPSVILTVSQKRREEWKLIPARSVLRGG